MNIPELYLLLPEHWEVITPEELRDPAKFGPFDYADDGRDPDKPIFVRKDGLARIYFNIGGMDTEYCFAIAWDWHGDGDCYGDFKTALNQADAYVSQFPLAWNEEKKEYR